MGRESAEAFFLHPVGQHSSLERASGGSCPRLSRHSASRAMAAHTKVGVGYDIQVAVDAKNKMIVEQAVTNQVVDTQPCRCLPTILPNTFVSEAPIEKISTI
jgi:hypothetical protein